MCIRDRVKTWSYSVEIIPEVENKALYKKTHLSMGEIKVSLNEENKKLFPMTFGGEHSITPGCIAPFAKIAGNNWLKNQSLTELEEVWIKNDTEGHIAIVSNSWGASPSFVDQDTVLEEYMKIGTETLRKYQGLVKGKIFVKAVGNGRYSRADSALHYEDNNEYIDMLAAYGPIIIGYREEEIDNDKLKLASK